MAKGPKDWTPETKRERELAKALEDLLEYITSGKHYEIRNPYGLSQVKEAIRLLDPEDHKSIYGPWR